MEEEKLPKWTKPWLLLCEGKDDLEVFNRLVEKHGLSGQFEVQYPRKNAGDSDGGNCKFAPYLLTLMETTRGKFLEAVKAVLIVSDSDGNRDDSFKSIADSLRKTKKLPVPTAERKPAKAPNCPSIVILMVPMDENGNLETLCLKAAYNKWPIREPLDIFISQTPANAWALTKQSKARIHSVLAATCEPKPDTNFAYHWQVKPEYHIPIEDQCFEGIVDFLKTFDKVLADA